MAVSKKKLRPLLIRLLNEENLPGLEWQDKQLMTWRLPWKSKKKTFLEDDDAVVLKEIAKTMWPQHENNLSKWKELLRNSLRSLSDIEIVEEDKLKPYKVYRFLEEKARKSSKGANQESNCSIKTYDMMNGSSVGLDEYNNNATMMPSLDISNNFRSRSPIVATEDSSSNSLASFSDILHLDHTPNSTSDSQETCSSSQGSTNMLDSESISDLLLFPNQNPCGNNLYQNSYENFPNQNPNVNNRVSDPNLVLIQSDAYTPLNFAFGITPADLTTCKTNVVETNHFPAITISDDFNPNNDDVITDEDMIMNQNICAEPRAISHTALHMEVKYGCHLIIQKPVQEQFAVYSGMCPVQDEFKTELPKPEKCEPLDQSQRRLINQLLEQMNRGIVFFVKDNDIYAKRLCKCRVISHTVPDDLNEKKLTRHEPIKIFDYQNGFKENLKLFRQKQTNKPKVYVQLGMGRSSADETSDPVYPISVYIHHLQAKKDLVAVDDELWPTEAPDGSNSDAYDRTLASLERLGT